MGGGGGGGFVCLFCLFVFGGVVCLFVCFCVVVFFWGGLFCFVFVVFFCLFFLSGTDSCQRKASC